MTRTVIGTLVCPVSLSDMKDFIGIQLTDTHRDAYLGGLTVKNMHQVEEVANVSLSAYTVVFETEQKTFKLPYGPVDSITSVKDNSGTNVSYKTIATDTLQLDTVPSGGVIVTYATKALSDVRLEGLKTAIKELTQMDYDGNMDKVARGYVLNSIIDSINGI